MSLRHRALISLEMKATSKLIIALSLALAGLSSCKEHYITYSDDEFVMFADTAKTYVVREDIAGFDIPIVSSVTCNYDRNFAVEVLDPVSSASEPRDFRLESYNFTIPAGSNTASVRVLGNMANLKADELLSFTLKLVMPERLVMPLYGDETIVRFKRTHKFQREEFTGWALVTSLFLYDFSLNGRYQRLIRTTTDPDCDNGVILHSFLVDGYDIRIRFDDDTDPLNPSVLMDPDQVASDEAQIFGTVHGDNHILMECSNMGPSYFFGADHIAVLVNRFYVENIGEEVGTVGHYLTEIDWVSDKRAEELMNEGL